MSSEDKKVAKLEKKLQKAKEKESYKAEKAALKSKLKQERGDGSVSSDSDDEDSSDSDSGDFSQKQLQQYLTAQGDREIPKSEKKEIKRKYKKQGKIQRRLIKLSEQLLEAEKEAIVHGLFPSTGDGNYNVDTPLFDIAGRNKFQAYVDANRPSKNKDKTTQNGV